MTEWICMDPDYPDRLCDYEDCEVACPYREARQKLEAGRNYFEFHCEKCDAEDCHGCSYGHIRGLLGMEEAKA